MKSWAVRQLASALSDYVDGISPETVQASLGRDIGILELSGARVSAQAVEKYGLELLNSELSVDARVPWRHLSSQPTTLSVRSVRLELRLRSKQVPMHGQPEEIKEAEVKKCEEQMLTEASSVQGSSSGFMTGRVARVSHAILRQLRVTLGKLEAHVHHELPEKALLTLSLGESRLESVGNDWTSLPLLEEPDLRKVLSFSGFEVRLGGRELFGPLSLQAKLLHSPEQALAKLWLELPQEADAAFRISAEMLTELRSWFDWAVRQYLTTYCSDGRELSEAAGQKYAFLYSQKIAGGAYDEILLAKLEDAATARWLAKWRNQSRLSCSKASSGSQTGEPSQWQWWGWATNAAYGPSLEAEPEVRDAWMEPDASDTVPSVRAFLDEVSASEPLPELATPTRLEVDMLIPQYTARCIASGGLLTASVGGVAFSLAVAAETDGSATSALQRRISATVKISSMEACLDGQPFVQLLQKPGMQAQARSFETEEQARRLESGDGMQLRLVAEEKPSTPWDVAVSLLGEPVQVQLAPWSLHGALRTAHDVWKAWHGGYGGGGGTGAADPGLPDLLEVPEEQDPALGSTMGFENLETRLTLRVEVEAPILRLQAWEDGAALELHLGRFFSRSLEKQRLKDSPNALNALTTLVDQEAEAIKPAALANFALLCELRDTRLILMEPGSEDRKPYEPSTIVFGAFLDEKIQLHTEATKIRLHIDPGLLHLLGQIRGGLDFAVAPLSKDFVGASPSSPLWRQPRKPKKASTFLGAPLSFSLTTSSLDIIWDPEGGRGVHDGSVKGHVAGFRVGLDADAAGINLVSSAQDVWLDCGDRRFLSSLGHVDLTAKYLLDAVRLQVLAPPLELRWAAESVRKGRAAWEAVQVHLQTGQHEALRRCERTTTTRSELTELSELSVSRALWDRFVAERTEELRGAWDQAFTNLAEHSISSSGKPVCVDLCLKSQELRAVVLRPGLSSREDREEIRTTILGMECRLTRQEELQLTSTLSSLEVWLGTRLLLAARQSDLPLLHARVSRRPRGRIDVDVTWAQIALVYRQRDFERMASLCHQEMSAADLSQTSSAEVRNPVQDIPTTAIGEGEEPEAQRSKLLKYCFNIDAPLLFLPASTGKRCDVGALSDLRGGLSTDPSLSQRTFLPLPDEGFGVLDLGNCLVENDAEQAHDPTIRVLLRRLQIFSVASKDRDKHQTWNQVLQPVTAKVEARSCADFLDIVVHVPLQQSQGSQGAACPDPLRLRPAASSPSPSSLVNLTRAQATQLFDVLYLNLTYASADEVEMLKANLKSRLQQEAERLTESRGFRFKLEWTGSLVVDAGFTLSSPLARLEMANGFFEFRRPFSEGESVERFITFACEGGCVKDARKGQSRLLIDLPRLPHHGLQISAKLPAEQDGITCLDVKLHQPNVWLLPQLWTDLLTWATSVYQQSAQADYIAGPGEGSRAQTIEVHVQDGAVRLPIAWDVEHFALVGDVLLSMKSTGDKLTFERLELPNARILRVDSQTTSRLLCEDATFFAKIANEKRSAAGVRLNAYSAEIVKIGPIELRLNFQDVLELSDMLNAVFAMEADTSEPEEEIRLRDPLSLVQRQKISLDASIEIDGIQLRLLAPRPVVEFALGCPLLQVHMQSSQGQKPIGSIFLQSLWLRIAALNERIAAWEPILGKSTWNVDFSSAVSGTHPEAKMELHAAPCSPIQLAVTVPVIRACSRLAQSYDDAVQAATKLKGKRCEPRVASESMKEKFEDTVFGLNLTGLKCLATPLSFTNDVHHFLNSDDQSKALALTAEPQGLDHLLSSKELKTLHLQIPGLVGAPKQVKVKAGETTLWHTSMGCLVVRVLVTCPPQLLLVVSSSFMLVNRTLLDLHVRLLGCERSGYGAGRLWPAFCIPTKLLEPSGPAVPLELSTLSALSSESEEAEAEASSLFLPSSFCLALPPQMLKNANASFQLRPSPAAVGGVSFSWGAPIHPNQFADCPALYSRSVASDFNLPVYGLRLSLDSQAPGASMQGMCQVDVRAPFSLFNACPVHLCYELRWLSTQEGSWAPQQLQRTTDSCEANETLHIHDGYGGIWEVPPNGFVLVAPLLLRHRSFQWWAGNRKEQQDCPKGTNMLEVKRNGGRVEWRFCGARRGTVEKHQPLRLSPGDEVPIYDLPEQFGAAQSGGVLRQALHRNDTNLPPLLLAVALMDRSTGKKSAWSLVTPVLVEGSMTSVPLDLGKGLWLRCARRTGQCQATVFANSWFNDATGLGAVVVRGRQPLPVFNSLAVVDAEAWGDDMEEDEDKSFFSVTASAGCRPVQLPNVGVGQSVKLCLTDLHRCILKSERISLSGCHAANPTWGSTLVTLMPAVLVFNTLECDFGIKQEGAQNILWLAPLSQASFYWSEANCPRRVQVALRRARESGDQASGRGELVWSASFDVSEHGLGAFPIVLSDTRLKDHLFCIQVSQCSGQLITITSAGSQACHQLMNRHPCLMVDLSYEGIADATDCTSHFVAVHGTRVAFGSSGIRPFQLNGSVTLIMVDIQSQKTSCLTLRLDCPVSRILEPSSELPIPVCIRLEVVDRVAHISISPVSVLGALSGETSSPLLWTLDIDIRIPALEIGIMSSKSSYGETLRCDLSNLSLRCSQRNGTRTSVIELVALQIDHHPRSKRKSSQGASVVIASLDQGHPWRMRIEREKLSGTDVALRSVCLEFFPAQATEEVILECNASEELLGELKDLLSEATPPQLEGLSLIDIARIAGHAYHTTLNEQPQPARKYILQDVQCGDFKIGIWCKLSSASLPGVISTMLKVSSFSHTLEIGGARVKLPRQRFFSSANPFEGSLEALVNLLVEKYKPFVSKSWRSILNNSNAVLGGFFSRYTWAPRQRRIELPKPSSMLLLQSGIVKLRGEIERTEVSRAQKAPSDLPLDGSGLASALQSRSVKQVQTFVRALVEMLGGQVTDEHRCAQYCESLLGAKQIQLDQLVEFITSKQCAWIS